MTELSARKNNSITLAAASAFLANAPLKPLLTNDEIFCSDMSDRQINFWMDGYMTSAHPNGGEIYSRFYVDFTFDQEKGLSLSFDADYFAIRTEYLRVTDKGIKLNTDQLEDYLAENLVERYTPKDDLEMISLFRNEFYRVFNGDVSMESIKKHPNFKLDE